MRPLIKPNRRSDCPFSITRGAAHCLLTGRRYVFQEHSAKSKAEALDKLADEAGAIIDANNARAGRVLKLSEHQQMLKGEFFPDQRPIRQRVMEDQVIRDNSTPNPGNQIENAMRGTDTTSKFWQTPERQAALRRIEALAQREDEVKAGQAADQARRSDPEFQRALEHAQATARLVAGDPQSTEAEIAGARDRLLALEAGWTGAQYWGVINALEAEEHPADKEADLQRQADAGNLAEQLRDLKGKAK